MSSTFFSSFSSSFFYSSIFSFKSSPKDFSLLISGVIFIISLTASRSLAFYFPKSILSSATGFIAQVANAPTSPNVNLFAS